MDTAPPIWVVRPLAIYCTALSTISADESYVSAMASAQLQSLMEKMNPDIVPTAAAAGDAITLREFLNRCPTEVTVNTDSYLGLNYIHIHCST